MPPLYDEWVSGGNVVFVETYQRAGESIADWRQRHDDAVAAAQILFPPDP